MQGIRDQRQRMNLPMGMSELDLIAYDKDLYALFRNEGEGWDKDAFRFDPIVGYGMLASDFAVADGLAWVNLLTPESQAAINPGDNLIVPVNTYDNYKQLPPWEKRLSHDVSFDGKNGNGKNGKNNESSYSANLLNLEASKIGMKHNFVGDFSYYFDNESRALGYIDPNVIITPPPPPPPPPARYKCINVAPWCVRDDVNGTRTTCTLCPTGVSLPPNPTDPNPPTPCSYAYSEWSACQPNSTQTRTAASSPAGCVGTPVLTQACSYIAPPPPLDPVYPSGTGTGTGGGTGTMPTEPAEPAGEPTGGKGEGAATPPTECKLNYVPIIIGIVIGLAIAYFIAKNKNKDVKQFGIVGAIIGGILGYVYAKHQCKPIEILSKIGVKSKSESGYYGGR